MFEECFSMIELNALLDMRSFQPETVDDDELFHHLSKVVLSALEAALFEAEQPPRRLN